MKVGKDEEKKKKFIYYSHQPSARVRVKFLKKMRQTKLNVLPMKKCRDLTKNVTFHGS